MFFGKSFILFDRFGLLGRGVGGEGGAAFFLRSLPGSLCVLRAAKHEPFAREEKTLRRPPVGCLLDAAFGGIWVSWVYWERGVLYGCGAAS